jgi:hypothetical protein
MRRPPSHPPKRIAVNKQRNVRTDMEGQKSIAHADDRGMRITGLPKAPDTRRGFGATAQT